MVPINHQTEIQFPRGEFYYMGTLSEFAIISLRGYLCVHELVCGHVGTEVFVHMVLVCLCLHECMKSVCLPLCICLQYVQYMCVVSVVADGGGVVSGRIR